MDLDRAEKLEGEVKIEKAKPEDVRGMQQVYYKTWAATYPDPTIGVTEEDIDIMYKDAFTADVLKSKIDGIIHPPEGATQLNAKIGNKVVGVCWVSKKPEKNQIETLYILPEYQKRGIASALWREAQKYLDATKDTYVAVTTYTNSSKFYERLGFTDTGRRWDSKRYPMKSGARRPMVEMVLKANR